MAPSIRPRGILVHRCETGATGTEVLEAEAKAGLGYHVFIRRDGSVDHMHAETELVWHALHWSRMCVGVALHGDFVPADHSRYSRPTSLQEESLVTLCAGLWHVYGPLPIMGHTDLPHASTDESKVCPGDVDLRKIQAQVFSRWAS